jgi:hypothetical protein
MGVGWVGILVLGRGKICLPVTNVQRVWALPSLYARDIKDKVMYE